MKRGKWYLQTVLGLYILSGVLFVAFGGLLMLNGAASSKKYLVAELIVLVELGQLLTGRGICDVDDFILNFAGAAAAALLMKLPFVTRLMEKWHCYTVDAPIPFPKERPERLPCAA